MPSLSDSRRHVQESLSQAANDIDHYAVLSRFQDEIDSHNALKSNILSESSQHRDAAHQLSSSAKTSRPTKFRFKSGKDGASSRKRSQSPRLDQGHAGNGYGESRRRSRKHRRQEDTTEPNIHPFPREPTSPSFEPSTEAAFRTSLFDALADDEGAEYWESVYGQPVHVYPRPKASTPKGGLDAMTDEDYVNYVKTKMWEKKHPEVLQQRKQNDREKKLEEEERTKRRERFVRRKEQRAWERSQSNKIDDGENDRYEYQFAGETNGTNDDNTRDKASANGWTNYLSAWDELKHDLVHSPFTTQTNRIVWPLLESQTPTKANVKAFMRTLPQRSRFRALKAERVKWHPDKMQQRFSGRVDKATLEKVTAVFQTMDELYEEERKCTV